VHAAARSHIAFLGVGSGESEAQMRQAGARHIIEDFADFAQLMRSLNEAEVPQAE
jgi:phosphoglycolate phosphatase-like HAD superfamily hydrolase